MTELLFGLVSTYGLPVIALSAFFSCLAVPIPTFAVMLAGGAFAATGDLDLWPVLLTAYLAAIAGDQTGYQIGRSGGTRLVDRLERRPSRAALVARARGAVEHYGGLGVFFSTWLVAPLGPWVNLIAGAARLDRWRFTLWDAAGEAIWVTGYVTLGYAFGTQLDALTALVGNWGGLISAASVMLISGAILLRRLRQAGKRRPPSDAPSSKE